MMSSKLCCALVPKGVLPGRGVRHFCSPPRRSFEMDHFDEEAGRRALMNDGRKKVQYVEAVISVSRRIVITDTSRTLIPSPPLLPAVLHGFRGAKLTTTGRYKSYGLTANAYWYAKKYGLPTSSPYTAYTPPSAEVRRLMEVNVWAEEEEGAVWMRQWYVHGLLCTNLCDPKTFLAEGTMAAYPLVRNLSVWLKLHEGATKDVTDLSMRVKVVGGCLSQVTFLMGPKFSLIEYAGVEPPKKVFKV